VMFRSLAIAVLAVAVISLRVAVPARAAPIRLAVFDFELQDASQEGEIDGVRADQTARLGKISRLLKELLARDPKYQLVNLAPYEKRIAEHRPLRTCQGCDIDIAREAGAQQSLYCFVYKVSNLILDIHIMLRDVATGQVLKDFNASIRGNTDASWEHGVRWLVRNRIEAAS